MRGVHRGVITLELVISLGLMATLCVAIMPSITAMVKSVRILSRRVEDSSTSLFHSRFPYGKDKEYGGRGRKGGTAGKYL